MQQTYKGLGSGLAVTLPLSPVWFCVQKVLLQSLHLPPAVSSYKQSCDVMCERVNAPWGGRYDDVNHKTTSISCTV